TGFFVSAAKHPISTHNGLWDLAIATVSDKTTRRLIKVCWFIFHLNVTYRLPKSASNQSLTVGHTLTSNL
ncbi:hypothetical protein, partial [Pseudoalteromonas luteoviolacea]|uniref:hypothetical protein n=1 Tax=Pseudoalteromonas luteoviolacea TaxID=43657 RepID=UPI001E48777F